MKKIFQLFILCVASIALISCGSRNFEGEIEEAVAANDFEQAHKILSECLDDLHKESDGLKQGIYVRCIVKVYTSEVNYLIESGDKSSSDRIIALYKEFSGKQLRDARSVEMSDIEYGNHILELAVNTSNQYLIEQCITSLGLVSSKSAAYILENNDDGKNVLINGLAKASAFAVPSSGYYGNSGYGVSEVEDFGIRINELNQVCLYIINQAIVQNDKELANKVLLFMKENLVLSNSDISYSTDEIDKAKSKINEAFGNETRDEQ